MARSRGAVGVDLQHGQRPRVPGRLLRAAGIGAVLVVLVGAYVLRYPRTPSAQTLGNVAVLLAAVVAAGSCALAARASRRDRPAWTLMAVAVGLWVVGQAFRTIHGVVHGHHYSFPSPADVGYVGYVLPAVAALLAFSGSGRREALRLGAGLDAAVVALAVLFVSWNTVLGPVVREGHGEDWVVRVVEMAYPSVDVVTVSAVLALGMRRAPGERGMWVLLGGGLVVLAVTDSFHVAAQHAGDTNPHGTLLAAGWMAAWFLVAAAPWVPSAPTGEEAGRRAELAIGLVPYLPVLVALFVLARATVDSSPFDFVVAALLLLVLSARQVVVVLRSVDLTRHLEAQVAARTSELVDAQHEAADASRMKSEFLATVSHEIRTPMNGVIGLTGLLLASELDNKQRRYAEGVHHAGEALLGIINDILDFSKIEAGRLELETIDFDLVQVVEEAAELVAHQAQLKDLELLVYCAPDLPVGVRGDPSRIRQVLLNLISNAVKFTSEGEVVVRAHLDDWTGEGVVVRFEVADTGIGIDRVDRQWLFEPFSQADPTTTRRFGGTGLGLAICRQLVTAMGGTIGVESEHGAGSVFWFTLPLGVADDQTPAPPRRDVLLAGLRALVVDDNQTNRLILSEQLMAWGMRPDVVEDGPTALAALAEAVPRDPYAVVVLDLCMPGMDGLEVARHIRADGALVDIALVLLTSGPDVSGDEAREAGIDAWLSKPVRLDDLNDALKAAYHRPQSGQAGASRRPAGRPPGSAGHVLIVEDNHVNQLVAAGMLEQLGYTSEVAGNGLEALAALDRRTFAAVLMDCQMPEMDGYEATRAIRRRQDDSRRVPVIAMTASATEQEREVCLAAGMDDFLAKPVSPRTLAGVLGRWTGRQPAASQAEGAAQPRGEVLDHARLDGLRAVTPGDPSFLDRIVTAWLATAPDDVARIRAAVSAGSTRDLREEAHALKGSAGNVGAHRVAAAAAHLVVLADAADLAAAAEAVGRLSHELDAAVAALRALVTRPSS